MFQGGSIRMAPRRFQTGKEVKKFEFDKPTTPLTRDIEAYIEGTGENKHLRDRLPILGKQLQILKNQKQAGYDIREDLASLSDLDLAEEYFAGTLQYLMTPTLSQQAGKFFSDTADKAGDFVSDKAADLMNFLRRQQGQETSQNIKAQGFPVMGVDGTMDTRYFAVPMEKPIPKPERVPTPISKPITQDSPTPTFPSDGYDEYLEFLQGNIRGESYSPDRFSWLPLDKSGRLISQSFNKGGPIRRQAGGGIEAVMPTDLGALVEQPPMPMPAPPPMPMPAPPPMAEELGNVQQTAETFGEQEGAQYVMNMMEGLNAAEESGDPEQAINALRGNEMPISERYEELATYVGDDDAERTPESVLLMTQPAIMLTEKGAMDSGIGSLMESVVGDIDMETNIGDPTPMGEGVGSLMMAQADTEVGEQPPVNFNYGGPVQRFSNGEEVNSYAQGFQDFLTDSSRNLFVSDEQALDYENQIGRIKDYQEGINTRFLIDSLSRAVDAERNKKPGSTFAGRAMGAFSDASENVPKQRELSAKAIDNINQQRYALEREGTKKALSELGLFSKALVKSQADEKKAARLQSMKIGEDDLNAHAGGFGRTKDGKVVNPYSKKYRGQTTEGLAEGSFLKMLQDGWRGLGYVYGSTPGPTSQFATDMKRFETRIRARMQIAESEGSGLAVGETRKLAETTTPTYFSGNILNRKNRAAAIKQAREGATYAAGRARVNAEAIGRIVDGGQEPSSEVYARNFRQAQAFMDIARELNAYAQFLDSYDEENKSSKLEAKYDKDHSFSKSSYANPEKLPLVEVPTEEQKPASTIQSKSESASRLMDDIRTGQKGPVRGETVILDKVSVIDEDTDGGPTNTELLTAIGRSETQGIQTPYTTLHEERNGERAVGKYGIKPSTAIQPGYGVPTVYQLAKDMDITVPQTINRYDPEGSEKRRAEKLLLDYPELQDAFAVAYFRGLEKTFGGLKEALLKYSGFDEDDENWNAHIGRDRRWTEWFEAEEVS